MVSEMQKERTALLTGFAARFQEPLAPYTTMKIGGPAEVIVFPRSISEVAELMKRFTGAQIPFLVLGNGSNLLVRDGGIEGVVIHLRDLDQVMLAGETLFYVEAGFSFQRLAVLAQKQGLSGIEFAAGIPGTVGGAVAMNAGIPGEEMESVVKSVSLVTRQGEQITIPKAECGFSYRATALPPGVIVAAEIALRHGALKAMEEKRAALLKRRRATQPLSHPNLGSIFKNPGSLLAPSAGQLIESVHLKGYSIGAAQISEQHGNFIINRGGATASDVMALIQLVEERVFMEKGVRLVPEIKIVGRDPERCAEDHPVR